MLHQPVLLHEINQLLPSNLNQPFSFLDVTAGYGGHAFEIFKHMPTGSRLVLMDRDPEAIAHLQSIQDHWRSTWHTLHNSNHIPPKIHLICRPFSQITTTLTELNLTKVHGMLADLGVSSPQMDQGQRGFAIQHHGPLDMRMNPHEPPSAAELLNTATEAQLADIFYHYGEEPKARRVATAIVRQRAKGPITTTTELAQLICNTIHYPTSSRRHPATRVFQALRIYINRELDELDSLLLNFPNHLHQHSRCGIISFHSLEDRRVKQRMKALARSHLPTEDLSEYFAWQPSPPQPPAVPAAATCKIIKPFPIVPSAQEIRHNPRSRSAKLRICTWLA